MTETIAKILDDLDVLVDRYQEAVRLKSEPLDMAGGILPLITRSRPAVADGGYPGGGCGCGRPGVLPGGGDDVRSGGGGKVKVYTTGVRPGGGGSPAADCSAAVVVTDDSAAAGPLFTPWNKPGKPVKTPRGGG